MIWGDTSDTLLGKGLRKPSNTLSVFDGLFREFISFILKQANNDLGDTSDTLLGKGLRKHSNTLSVFDSLFRECISFILKSKEALAKMNSKTATKNNHKYPYREYLLIINY